MSLITYVNDTAKNLDGVDIGLVKLYVLAMAFLIAKFYPPVLSLDWYWYAGIAILAAIRPLYRSYTQ
jgi:hypothetical protein